MLCLLPRLLENVKKDYGKYFQHLCLKQRPGGLGLSETDMVWKSVLQDRLTVVFGLFLLFS